MHASGSKFPSAPLNARWDSLGMCSLYPCMWANANVINIPNSGFFENGDVGVIFRFIRTPRKVREMVLRLREKENPRRRRRKYHFNQSSTERRGSMREVGIPSFLPYIWYGTKKTFHLPQFPSRADSFFCSYSP